MSFLLTTKSTVLITGGSSGIGFALAKKLSTHGQEVIIVDKDQKKLDKAQSECPQLIAICADLINDEGRKSLKEQVISAYPQVNVLINAACVNNNPPLLVKTDETQWEGHEQEFEVNLLAPIHLSLLFLPHFQQKPHALILNITSLFAFFPLVSHPTFCATKAALHSFSLSLRYQLRDSSVQVIELIPPLIEGPAQAPQFKGHGVAVDQFVKCAMSHVLRDEIEVGYGDSEPVMRASRDQLDELFAKWNDSSCSFSDTTEGVCERKSGNGKQGPECSQQKANGDTTAGVQQQQEILRETL